MADNILNNLLSRVDSLFGGIFTRALRVTQRNLWQNVFMGNRQAVVTDMNNLLEVYQSCPYLAIVINKKAEMLSNGVLKVRNRKDGKEVEKHWVLEFLKNPNPLQKFKEFTKQYSIYSDIYANAYVYRNVPTSISKPKVLWNLPPEYMKVITTGKWLDQWEIEGIIEKYELQYGGVLRNFSTKEVKHVSSGISKNNIITDSKFIALQHPISNMIGALKTRNIFIYYGPKIILSNQAKDADGGLPMKEGERKRIQKEVNQGHYGIEDSQSHMVITEAALTSTMLSYPTKDLMLFEEIEEDFGAICGAYGMDRDIFPSIKGATNENKKQGEIATYQSTIEACAKSFTEMLEDWLMVEQEVELYMDFSHLSIMQEDKEKEAREKKIKIDGLQILLDKGIITNEQFALELGLQYAGDDTSKKNQIFQGQMRLRELVGAASAVVDANIAVANGDMDVDAAVNMLIGLFGFEKTEATAMITTTIKPVQERTGAPKPSTSL